MSQVATASIAIQYTPPSAPVGSGSVSTSFNLPYDGINSGTIDLAIGSGTNSYTIPFLALAKSRVLLIRNNTQGDLGVRFNGAGVDAYKIPVGGFTFIGATVDASATPITGIVVHNYTNPTSIATIDYFVLGT